MVKTHSAVVQIVGQGKITVPIEIREFENLKKGDFLFVTFEKMEQPTQLQKN